LRKHILHALGGHGGERWIVGAPVEGYDPTTNTVFQYHGSYWHRCLRYFPKSPGQIIKRGQNRENRYLATEAGTRALREAGNRVIEKWESNDQETQDPCPGRKRKPTRMRSSMISSRTKTNPEARATEFLTYENAHAGFR